MNKERYVKILFVIALVVSLPLGSIITYKILYTHQYGSVYIYVYDGKDFFAPLEKAVVCIDSMDNVVGDDAKIPLLTGTYGIAPFSNITNGLYTIYVVREGYENIVAPVEVKYESNNTAVYEIGLSEEKRNDIIMKSDPASWIVISKGRTNFVNVTLKSISYSGRLNLTITQSSLPLDYPKDVEFAVEKDALDLKPGETLSVSVRITPRAEAKPGYYGVTFIAGATRKTMIVNIIE